MVLGKDCKNYAFSFLNPVIPVENLGVLDGALEKAVAPHSSILAQRIPGMGEPGGLPSVGSHRVRDD